MDQAILEWLLEEENPEVRLRTLKEYEKLPEDDARVTDCKKRLLQSKVYERGLKKLRSDKPWAKYDALLAFAEWGLTRADIGADIDGEVFALIESTGFKMLCGEPLLLRNLVKLGYGPEEIVKNEIDSVLGLIKEDGGFRCISTNKKINDPRKPHKSCARLTVEYLLLAAELHLLGYRPACEKALTHYFYQAQHFLSDRRYADAHGGRDAGHVLSAGPHQDRGASDRLRPAGIGLCAGVGGHAGRVQRAESAQVGQRTVCSDSVQERTGIQGRERRGREQVGDTLRLHGAGMIYGRGGYLR
ncbi:MAG: hypothetical protein IKD50_02805 [Clostridia bacterium]|nr:hypothetical protein [Clostridia bacterium]